MLASRQLTLFRTIAKICCKLGVIAPHTYATDDRSFCAAQSRASLAQVQAARLSRTTTPTCLGTLEAEVAEKVVRADPFDTALLCGEEDTGLRPLATSIPPFLEC